MEKVGREELVAPLGAPKLKLFILQLVPKELSEGRPGKKDKNVSGGRRLLILNRAEEKAKAATSENL